MQPSAICDGARKRPPQATAMVSRLNLIKFTTGEAAEALYYYNALASGRMVNGTYPLEGNARSFLGLVVSVDKVEGEDAWSVVIHSAGS